MPIRPRFAPGLIGVQLAIPLPQASAPPYARIVEIAGPCRRTVGADLETGPLACVLSWFRAG
jgi:hypothetical protein